MYLVRARPVYDFKLNLQTGINILKKIFLKSITKFFLTLTIYDNSL